MFASSRTTEARWIVGAGILLMTAALLSACGPTQYQKVSQTSEQEAPGVLTIPPKVDILLAVSDNGGMDTVVNTVAEQTKTFLNQLEQKQWDYRFTTLALTQSPLPVSEVAASRYDGNWYHLGQWLSPYPGATPSDPGMSVPATLFRTVSSFGQWITQIRTDSQGQKEDGIEHVTSLLSSSGISSGFLRDDALLAVVIVSKQNDTSGAQLLQQGTDPVARWRFPGTSYDSTLNSYVNTLRSLKSNPGMVQAFPVVPYTTGACAYGNGLYNQRGQRYIDLGSRLGTYGGQAALSESSLDICSRSIPDILGSISSQLTSTELLLTTRYLVLDREPDMSKTQVLVYRGGAAPAVTLSPDAYSYQGYQTVFLKELSAPSGVVRMNRATGYVIQLRDDVVLKGRDRADVVFQDQSPNP